MDAHNLGWKLALVVSGRAPDTLLDTYGTERRPVAEDVLKLTHALVDYGTMSQPVKRRVRDIVVPALGRARSSSAGWPAGSARSTPPTRRDYWPARTAAEAGREPASACPTSTSARAASPPRCTASCAVADTSW